MSTPDGRSGLTLCCVCEDIIDKGSVCPTCARVLAEQHPELIREAITPKATDYGTGDAKAINLTPEDFGSMWLEMGWRMDFKWCSGCTPRLVGHLLADGQSGNRIGINGEMPAATITI